eukprot:5470330-Pyramimonas_sp.AAC.1
MSLRKSSAGARDKLPEWVIALRRSEEAKLDAGPSDVFCVACSVAAVSHGAGDPAAAQSASRFVCCKCLRGWHLECNGTLAYINGAQGSGLSCHDRGTTFQCAACASF